MMTKYFLEHDKSEILAKNFLSIDKFYYFISTCKINLNFRLSSIIVIKRIKIFSDKIFQKDIRIRISKNYWHYISNDEKLKKDEK